jgi:S1-C subfamily serine protease
MRLGLLIFSILLAREAAAADEALRSAVVRIEVDKLVTRQTTAGNLRTKTETYVGSGFWASGTRRIVTCAHVLDGARRVSVTRYAAPPSQKPWSTDNGQVTLCLSDPGHDIAVIEVPETGLGLPLTTSTVATSAPIRSVGHTEDVPWRITEGHFTQTITAREIDIPLDGDVHICDVSFGPGSSGGIVIDRENRILGMIEGGKSAGRYGTRLAIPASTIQQTLLTLASSPCRGGLITTGTAIVADENTFAGLLHVGPNGRDQLPARFWGQGAFGIIMGADQFDDPVPTLQLEFLRASNNMLSWALRAQWAQRSVDRTVESGTEQIADAAEMKRFSVAAGPRFLLKEFGPVSVYSTASAGYVRDQITHDYTFTSPLFAPQSYDQSASGLIGQLSLDADIQIVLNLRLGLSSEVWQGSGDIGNGVTNYVGLRFGVGRGSS